MLPFCAPTSITYLELTVTGRMSDGVSMLPSLITLTEQYDIEETLALSDMGAVCFQCSRPATFEACGLPWCTFDCAHEVTDALEPCDLAGRWEGK